MSGGGVDAMSVDLHRSGPLAGRAHVTYHGVPPVKQAPFDLPHIPVYFWVGGIAAGSWLAATVSGSERDGDPRVVRAGRYLTLASVTSGAGLLILDLGRPERFLNMLRVFRPSSAMSLGSWALASFGALAGAVALLQAAEDGLLGERPGLARLSRGAVGRTLGWLGLPSALFVGTYTGVLLSSTASPSWARRGRLLGPLFAASAVANGLAAVDLAVHGAGPGDDALTARRLSRAQAVALSAELLLETLSSRAAHGLPSGRREPAASRAMRWAAVAGIGAPLAAHVLGGWGRRPRRARPRRGLRIAAAVAGLAGGLLLRFVTVEEGQRSAATPEDTWALGRDAPRPRSDGGQS